jgi:hypothetical protein
VLGVSRYAYDIPRTVAYPPLIAVSELECFERPIENIEELDVAVAVEWDSNPRGNRAADEANLGPGFVWAMPGTRRVFRLE